MQITGAMMLMALSATVSGDRDGSGLSALLDQRSDASSSRRIVSQLEGQLDRSSDALELRTALLQAKHYLAIRHLEDDAQEKLLKEGLQEGLETLADVLGTRIKDFDDLVDNHMSRLPSRAAGALFWTTANAGRLIKSRSVFARPGAALNFFEGLSRVVALDETYYYGGAHRALAQYQLRAPGFLKGDKKAALQHAARALELAPEFASNAVVLTEVVSELKTDSPELVSQILSRATSTDDRKFPGFLPEQRFAKAKAKMLLEELN
ncbi:MAG: TRAP transporter TatT component family protein [Myxococcota bacterium]